MLDVLYEDKDVLVVVKPAGIESQRDQKLSPPEGAGSEKVIHRFIPKSIHSHGGAVCWSYPPAGQAGARRDGVCQEPEGGSALEPSGTGRKTGENLSGCGMWKTCG